MQSAELAQVSCPEAALAWLAEHDAELAEVLGRNAQELGFLLKLRLRQLLVLVKQRTQPTTMKPKLCLRPSVAGLLLGGIPRW